MAEKNRWLTIYSPLCVLPSRESESFRLVLIIVEYLSKLDSTCHSTEKFPFSHFSVLLAYFMQHDNASGWCHYVSAPLYARARMHNARNVLLIQQTFVDITCILHLMILFYRF